MIYTTEYVTMDGKTRRKQKTVLSAVEKQHEKEKEAEKKAASKKE